MSIADLAGAEWRKSSRSSDTTACVEVAQAPPVVGVRDSKKPAPILTFGTPEWVYFIDTVNSR